MTTYAKNALGGPEGMLRSCTAVAHSKVNLDLTVGPLREDRYHELTTVFQSLSLADHVTLTVTDLVPRTHVTYAENTLEVTGYGADVTPTDSSNLAWQAANRLIAMAARRPAVGGCDLMPRVAISIAKGIPVAGGMAGGSADAAAALRATAAILAPFVGPIPESVLLDLAAQLGSDVPFTLLGGTMQGTGRGENLVPSMCRGTFHWALALQKEGLSTPRVFQKLDELREERPSAGARHNRDQLSKALITGDAAQLAKFLANDLQAPALSIRPVLRRVLDAGRSAGALGGMVSGSGPTCAFLCADAQAAEDVAAELLASGLAHLTTTATSPAAGAVVAATEPA